MKIDKKIFCKTFDAKLDFVCFWLQIVYQKISIKLKEHSAIAKIYYRVS